MVQKIENAEVTLTMGVKALEAMLDRLGTHPFNDVANTIIDLRNQAGQQLQAIQQAQQHASQQVPMMPGRRGNGLDEAAPA